MKVRGAMTKEVKRCAPETDLATVAQSIWMRDCGVLPVVDGKGEVVGIITDRDVCIATGCVPGSICVHRTRPEEQAVKAPMQTEGRKVAA